MTGPGPRGERGSASIWVLACCGLLVVVGTAGVMRAGAVFARHRAESAADLAALAAAAQIGIAQPGTVRPESVRPESVRLGAAATGAATAGCAAARAVAVANGADVTACSIAVDADGRTGTVRVRVTANVRLPVVGVRSITASARAARLPAVPTSVSAGSS